MNISFFSFLMSVLFSTGFILMIHVLRNRPFFLKSFGVHTLLIMYGICLFRMIFVIELPFAVPVGLKGIFSNTYATMRQMQVPVGGSNADFVDVLLGVWIIIAVIIFIRLLWQEYTARSKLSLFRKNKNYAAERALEKIMKHSRKKASIHVCVCPDIDVPMGMGIFRKWIFLPDEEYTDGELFYIMAHEYTHFSNRDGVTKLLILLLCCVFWWNPAVYLLKKDVDQVLEIKCDVNATQEFSKKERQEYLLTIIRTLKGDPKAKSVRSPLIAMGFVSRTEHDDIRERFELITKATKQIGWKYQTAFLSFALLVLLISYTFVFQSAFDPPMEDIYTNDSVYEVDLSTCYIVRHENGSYSMLTGDGDSFPLNNDIAESYIAEGIELRKDE